MDGECRMDLQNGTGQDPWLVHSFIQEITYFVLGTVLGAGDLAVNKTDKNSFLLMLLF